MEGWYQSTFLENYCSNNCHVKATRSKCLTDTTASSHRIIINPTIIHAVKIILAISTCSNVNKVTSNDESIPEIQYLKQLKPLRRNTRKQHPPLERVGLLRRFSDQQVKPSAQATANVTGNQSQMEDELH